MPPLELADRLLARERAAVAEALNLIDDQRPAQRTAAETLLEQLEGECGAALRVGLTGPPGAGKSTLIDALVRKLREREQTVGIIAVDPSSSRSGGALLGDRVRVSSRSSDPGVFVRSMAARDRLGGLAEATRAGVDILSAAFDVVLIETVGVGQSESDVSSLVDTLVFVAQPSAGDTLQFMKAGLLELPDIFVVNKADQGPAADRTRNELGAGMGLGEARADRWVPPILLASARDARGIDELVEAIDAHRVHLEETGQLAERRQRGKVQSVIQALERRYGSHGIDTTGGRGALAERIRQADGRSTHVITRTLGAEIERRLRSSP
jgi:LAO/AO transport system kinase